MMVLLGRRAGLLAAVAAMVRPAHAQLPSVITPDTPLPSVVRPTHQAYRTIASAKRAHNGQFYFDAAVNGAPVQMLFDTGASQIVLRAEDAARLGINMGTLTYNHSVSTANGKTDVAPVLIPVVTIGNISRRDVQGVVAKPGTLGVNLLGQSFLTRLAGYRTEGDVLILHGGE